MEELTDYYIFRLSFEPYMRELSGPLPLETLEKIRNYVLEHLLDITFKDGNGESTTAFGSTVFGQMGYVTIEKRTNHLLNQPNCKEQTLVDDYPDFNLVVDGRRLKECNCIILAIEFRRQCFSNIDTVRRGLEKYFDTSVGRQFLVNAHLGQVSSSDKFWNYLEEKILNGASLSMLRLEIKPHVGNELICKMDPEKATLFSSLLCMMMDVGGDNGALDFKAGKGKELNLERARKNLGMVVDMACKNGFVVKAKLRGENSWIRSDATAPVIFELDRSVVLKPADNNADKESISRSQFDDLTRWFNNIYDELEKIERKKKDEETRCITER